MTTHDIDRALDREARRDAGERIVRVDAALRLAAVERLVGGDRGPSARTQAEQFVRFSATNGVPIDAMWARLGPNGDVVGTVLAVPNPGRTAILFSSPPRDRRGVPDQADLVAHVCGHLPGLDVDLAQVLLEPRETLLREAFLGAGFHELAALSYLERPVRRRVAAPEWPADVTVEPYDESTRDDVLAVLDASYEDTRDCPGLRGLRRTEDILDGHRATGAFDPSLWTILRVDGAPRGVLLLNPAPASNVIELVYIGLARDAQGRGLGRHLLRHGLRLLADRPERAVTLAVDDANDRAIALYRHEGFHRVLRRVALIRSMRAAANDTAATDGT